MVGIDGNLLNLRSGNVAEALQARTLDVLEGAAAELNALGADPALVRNLQDEIIQPFRTQG